MESWVTTVRVGVAELPNKAGRTDDPDEETEGAEEPDNKAEVDSESDLEDETATTGTTRAIPRRRAIVILRARLSEGKNLDI